LLKEETMSEKDKSNFLKGLRQALPIIDNTMLQMEQVKAYDTAQGKTPNYPELSSGGRVLVSVAGRAIAICQKFSYSIKAAEEEIRSIDNHIPWDIFIGQVTVRASLSQLVHPNNPAESEGIWSTMASIIHQPIIEIEIYDQLGARLFATRGMFVGMTSEMAQGGLTNRSLEFVGITYAHGVNQKYKPYSDSGKIAGYKEAANASLRKLGI
jgi:hypothetical protein